jgi:hypothetical protein
LNFDAKITFFGQLTLLKAQYCFENEFGDEGLVVLA